MKKSSRACLSIRPAYRSKARLYDRYAPAMYNVCMRMMAVQEEAEDILQEAFCGCILPSG